MIARVEIRKGEKELTLEDYNILMRVCDKKEVDKIPSYFYIEESVVEVEEACATLLPLGFEIKIINFKNNVYVGIGEKLKANFDDEIPVPPGPNITHIHIPNVGLLMIDEVKLLENTCTNTLQMELDEGWRILAVCPPNGVRRPDYILGRTKEK